MYTMYIKQLHCLVTDVLSTHTACVDHVTSGCVCVSASTHAQPCTHRDGSAVPGDPRGCRQGSGAVLRSFGCTMPLPAQLPATATPLSLPATVAELTWVETGGDGGGGSAAISISSRFISSHA